MCAKRILACPVTHNFPSRTYGKTYNIAKRIELPNTKIELCVGVASQDLESSTVTVTEILKGGKKGYYLRALWYAQKSINSGNIDLYHHMNLNYNWFNPLLVGQMYDEDLPILIGPAQAPHIITDDELEKIVDSKIPFETPDNILKVLSKGLNSSKDCFDTPRFKLFKKTLNAADTVVVVNKDTKNIYSQFMPEDKIEVVPLGVDLDYFEKGETRKENTIVSVGYLNRRKGFDILLRAMNTISDSFPESSLEIFGDGPQMDDLKRLAISEGVYDSVTFHGHVDQSKVKDALKRATVFVHPSRSESFSPVRLEAMASGCPMVVTNIVGADEMVRDAKEGYVVEPTPDDIANSVCEILQSPELVTAMSRSSRDRAEQKYDWDKITDRYESIYQNLLN